MKRALVLGGAENVFDDAHAAYELCNFELVVACKRVVEVWQGIVHVFATLHVNDVALSLAKRKAGGYSVDHILVYAHQPPMYPQRDRVDHVIHDWAGSSGLFGVQAALHRGATHIVCAGVPLDVRGHFDKTEHWVHAPSYRRGWKRHQDDLRNVRSMSGWTAEFVGRPTMDWLNGKDR